MELENVIFSTIYGEQKLKEKSFQISVQINSMSLETVLMLGLHLKILATVYYNHFSFSLLFLYIYEVKGVT